MLFTAEYIQFFKRHVAFRKADEPKDTNNALRRNVYCAWLHLEIKY
jgi:hypothetical protein